MPLDRDNKMNLVAASFSYFGRTFMKKKKKFKLKNCDSYKRYNPSVL